jgi:hypothetical protein
MRNFHNITWNDILEDVFTVNEGDENQKTFALGKTGDGKKFIAPLDKPNVFGDLTLLLVNVSGENLKIDTNTLSLPKEYSDFKWAEKKLPILRDTVAYVSHSKEGKQAFSLFNKQKGVLVLCEQTADDVIFETSMQRGKNNLFLNTKQGNFYILGQNYNDKPVILLSSLNSRLDETLVHELTHRIESVTPFSSSPLFAELCDFYERSSSDIVKKHADIIRLLTKRGIYYPEQFHSEMFARLNEEKYKNPQVFREKFPLLQIFYDDIVSPYVNAVLHNRTTEKIFFDSLMKKPLMSPEMQKEFDDLKSETAGFVSMFSKALQDPFTYPGITLKYQLYKTDEAHFVNRAGFVLSSALKRRLEKGLSFCRKREEQKKQKKEKSSFSTLSSFFNQTEEAWFFSDEYQMFNNQKALKRKEQMKDQTPPPQGKIQLLDTLLQNKKNNGR